VVCTAYIDHSLVAISIIHLPMMNRLILQQLDKKVSSKICLKSPEVVDGDSKSSPKSSKAPKPNFREPMAAKSSPIGTFSPTVYTRV